MPPLRSTHSYIYICIKRIIRNKLNEQSGRLGTSRLRPPRFAFGDSRKTRKVGTQGLASHFESAAIAHDDYTITSVGTHVPSTKYTPRWVTPRFITAWLHWVERATRTPSPCHVRYETNLWREQWAGLVRRRLVARRRAGTTLRPELACELTRGTSGYGAHLHCIFTPTCAAVL